MHGSESRQASMRLNEKDQGRYVAMLRLCFSGENLQESGHLGGEGVQMMLVEQKKSMTTGDLYGQAFCVF